MDKVKQKVSMIDGWEYIHCPVCGGLVETYDICDTCHWQNTGPVNIDGGPNKITLSKAKKIYQEKLAKVNKSNQNLNLSTKGSEPKK